MYKCQNICIKSKTFIYPKSYTSLSSRPLKTQKCKKGKSEN